MCQVRTQTPLTGHVIDVRLTVMVSIGRDCEKPLISTRDKRASEQNARARAKLEGHETRGECRNILALPSRVRGFRPLSYFSSISNPKLLLLWFLFYNTTFTPTNFRIFFKCQKVMMKVRRMHLTFQKKNFNNSKDFCCHWNPHSTPPKVGLLIIAQRFSHRLVFESTLNLESLRSLWCAVLPGACVLSGMSLPLAGLLASCVLWNSRARARVHFACSSIGSRIDRLLAINSLTSYANPIGRWVDLWVYWSSYLIQFLVFIFR